MLLINPKNIFKAGIYHSEEYSVPPMNLGIIAALTPGNWDMQIIDENFDDFEFTPADLVILTALTSQVTRAYEIASIYREKGIPTVIGGIHASMMPDEALGFAWERMFDLKVLKRKYLNTLKSTRNVAAAGWALSTNLKYHNTVFEGEKEEYNYPEVFEELTSIGVNAG